MSGENKIFALALVLCVLSPIRVGPKADRSLALDGVFDVASVDSRP